MSLQIWLPLINDLTNYGLRKDITFSIVNDSNKIAKNSYGKIGACYERTTANTSDCIRSSVPINLTGSFSMFCWAYVSAPGDVNSANGIITNHSHSHNAGAGITVKCVSSTDFRISCNTGTGSSRTYQTYYGTTNIKDAWHHLGLTYDASTTTLSLYVDGVMEKTLTYAMACIDTYFDLFNWSTTHYTSGSYRPVCKLNDVRVYDHCLDQKEIRLLSQGLLAHFPLKDTATETTTNLAPYPTPGGAASADWDASLHQGAINVSNWSNGYNGGVSSATAGYHAHWKMIDGIPTVVFPDLNSLIDEPGRWLGVCSQTNLGASMGPSTTYTISFDAKADVDGKQINFGLYYKLNNSDGTVSGAGFQDEKATLDISKSWNRYSYTWTTKSNMNTTYGRIYIYGDYGVEGTSYVRNIQLELKDHATEYTPNARTTTPLMDCSGYGHHGTGVGTLTSVADSARYDKAIYITDGRYNYGKSGLFTMPTDQITMSCWIKSSTTGYSGYHIPLSFNAGNYELSIDGSGHFRNGFNIAGSRAVLTTSHTSILDGEWHMITATYDGNTIRRYVDGVELTSYATAITGALAGGNSYLLIGNYNGTTYGNKNTYMSDVRVYATALSADDILNLYQTRMSITNTGASIAYEYFESALANIKITSEGVVKTDNIAEIGPISGMKVKTLSDGSAWSRIHWLDVTHDDTYFTNSNEVLECTTATNRYSRMGLVDKFAGKKISVTNLMPAINTTNYSGGTASTAYVRYGANSLMVTGTTSTSETYLKTTGTVPYIPGHTYYARAELLQETIQGTHDWYWKIAEPLLYGSKAITKAKTWTKVSGIRPASTIINRNGADWDAGNYQVRLDYNNSKVAGAMWFDGLMLIDLTATFGSGNEPTVAWCDENIPYFTGTKTLELNDDNVSWYEFMLTYPRLSNTLYNRWKQTSSPNATTVVNYTPITIAWSTHSGGIRKHGSSCLYNCDTGSTWYAPIGQYEEWTSTQAIPGANGNAQTETELWVRIDTLPALTNFSMFDNKYIQASQIYEI